MKTLPNKIKSKIQSDKLASLLPDDISSITPEEVQCLIYELQCHQIELEMQNDELRKAQLELTDLNNRLQWAYHQVPVGIVTLDSKGFIQEANFHLAKMLHTMNSNMINRPFSRFIVDNDLYGFIRQFNDFFMYPEDKAIQLRLKAENSKTFPVLIKGSADDGYDVMREQVNLEQRKLVIVVTEIGDLVTEQTGNSGR